MSSSRSERAFERQRYAIYQKQEPELRPPETERNIVASCSPVELDYRLLEFDALALSKGYTISTREIKFSAGRSYHYQMSRTGTWISYSMPDMVHVFYTRTTRRGKRRKS